MGAFLIKKVATGVKFDLVAGNGEVVATSEVYKTAAACRKGIESVIRNAAIAATEDLTAAEKPLPNPKFELYRDRADAFRFRLRSRNGSIIAVSEGYQNRTGCLSGIESVRQNAKNPELIPFFEK